MSNLISIVIPVYNEEQSLGLLFEKISAVMKDIAQKSFEVIFIDDGSEDGSWEVIEKFAAKNAHTVRAVRFRKNFGKSQALSVGFALAQGDPIISMDADLQDDPQEIPIFLEMIKGGADLVSGWKINRKDPLSKTLPSKVFNAVVQVISGVKLHDFNCGFKAYRREVLKHIKIYGELHRFIPVLAYGYGFKIAEVSVRHNPREFGHSKYGLERYARGFLDLLTVITTTRFIRRPSHLFGGWGIIAGLIGFSILLYLSIHWVMGTPIAARPLFFLGIMLSIMSVQMISLGLIAELFIYYAKSNENEELIKQKINLS